MMDKLPPDARAFLDAVASSDDPSALERARADAGLRAALQHRGLANLPTLPTLPTLTPAAVSGSARVGGGALALKLGAVGLAVIGAGALAVVMLRPAPSETKRTPELARTIEPPLEATAPPAREVEVSREEPKHGPVRARPHNAPRPVQAPQNDDALQRELRVVAQADALLRQGRYADTLRLLDASERATHTNVLHEERSALRILAQCGRATDERSLRESERFLRSAPQAVLAARVREACKLEQP